MKKYFVFSILLVFSLVACSRKQKSTVQLINKPDERKVEVLYDGELFTSYIYPTIVMKPVLWPIITSAGTEITRHYPLNKIAGERTDHPHHIGMWLNYGDVNGYDFWNNSEAIPSEKKEDYGTITQKKIVKISTSDNVGILVVNTHWIAGGKKQLDEVTTFHFINNGNIRIIDRITKLTAKREVHFTDNKEGFLGIRLTSELELPSAQEITLTDSHGNPTDIKTINARATGNYLSSKGVSGNDVWGTRAKWVKLNGHFEEEQVEVIIIDHRENIGYPTYWHARGYGLFAANPLGQRQLSGGKEQLNFSLKEGESVTFKYRTIISSNTTLSNTDINQFFNDFSTK